MSTDNVKTENGNLPIFDVTKRKPVWITLESYHADERVTSLKQHAFIPYTSNGGNERNKSLCGKIRVGNDEGKSAIFNTITDRAEMIDESNICKKCLQIYLSNYAL